MNNAIGGYATNMTFDNVSRIGLDSCSVDMNSIMNVAQCNYMTQNYYAGDCTMKNPIAFATSQPGINYSGGHGLGIGGCQVDTSSMLRMGALNTHPKGNITLFTRPYGTVPYLGRGSVDPVFEAQLMQGEQIINKKSVTRPGEKSHMPYRQHPTNMQVSVPLESDTYANWVRGGIQTKNLSRDNNMAQGTI